MDKAKILIIDDDPDFRDAITPILESVLYDVSTASNPKEGREKILMDKPDLILMDVMMDSLFDGFSLCHAVKTGKEFHDVKDTPIIFISAVRELTGVRFQIGAENQGMRGPDDYLDKPVKPDVLLDRIARLLKT
jgi:DNA-binding response OmpR family regulator